MRRGAMQKQHPSKAPARKLHTQRVSHVAPKRNVSLLKHNKSIHTMQHAKMSTTPPQINLVNASDAMMKLQSELNSALAEYEAYRTIAHKRFRHKKWTPHPHLARKVNVQKLENYRYDHQQRLAWYRSKIADTPNSDGKRQHWRTNISIEKCAIKYIEQRIRKLTGVPEFPRLLPDNSPTYKNDNPFIQSITMTYRIPRDYDYPGKAQFEPLARKQALERAAAAQQAI